ncbi:unnamed protein product [Porites lobata]|uniref:Transposase domain-containing protein n=1 Tax=Porites lobata TaxID=104759 RepID=A0ABN8QT44_9CNID|nr:unnamed protein product [Porites lobata]
MESTKRKKRGRYNSHRRNPAIPKPKATVSRHNRRKANFSSDEDEQRKKPCFKRTVDVVFENSQASSDESDLNITNMYLASCSSYQDLDHELSDVLSESTHDDDSVEKLDAIWSDISEDDRSSTSSDDDQFCARGDSYNHIRSKSTDEEDPVYVYPGSPLLLSESILLILTLAVAHNLNGSCLSDVISLINLHCIPGPLNKCVNSLSELKRYFADFELPITKHFYCSFCSEYLGVLSDTPDVCSICNNDVRDPKKKSYFVILSVESQLNELMQRLVMEIPDKGNFTSHVFLLGSVLDLPARCSFLEMVQYNGFCSCCYCMVLGMSCKSSVKEGHRGRVTVFPFNFESNNGLAKERTKESMVADGLQFLQGTSGGKPVNGMKGVCQFASLKHYDISKGVCLDYMHGVLLGVTRQLMALWFDSKHKDQPWYCGDRVSIIDERLCSIHPPMNITRTPRPIETHRKYFKATEYRNWLFYYSVPCLVGVLPDVYLHHFMLLAFSVWLVNQQTISPEEVNQSGNLLAKFVMLMDALYSERHMTINIHNLLHIHASVHNLGPLWANSTFDFEDANGELTALFHGTQNIDMQIASSVSAVKIAPDLARKLDKDSPSYSLYRRMKFGKEQKYVWQ